MKINFTYFRIEKYSAMEKEFDRNDPKSINLSEEEQHAIKESNLQRDYKKGDLLIREGQISSDSFYVLTGCVRQYYLVDGEEKTTEFYTENQSIFSNLSSNNKVPSKYFLECVEDSLITVTSADQQKSFYKRFPRFEALCRVTTEQEFAEYQERTAQFMISSPEERYLNLLNTRPDLFNRVPQYQLASYLGIKPESLSRIRKRIATKKNEGRV